LPPGGEGARCNAAGCRRAEQQSSPRQRKWEVKCNRGRRDPRVCILGEKSVVYARSPTGYGIPTAQRGTQLAFILLSFCFFFLSLSLVCVCVCVEGDEASLHSTTATIQTYIVKSKTHVTRCSCCFSFLSFFSAFSFHLCRISTLFFLLFSSAFAACYMRQQAAIRHRSCPLLSISFSVF
jgi:4-hydroxybenzoate polyprenyltransferase